MFGGVEQAARLDFPRSTQQQCRPQPLHITEVPGRARAHARRALGHLARAQAGAKVRGGMATVASIRASRRRVGYGAARG